MNQEHPCLKGIYQSPLRVGLIGYGAIGEPVAQAILDGRAGGAILTAILVRDVDKHRKQAAHLIANPAITFTDNADEFFASDFNLLIEAAGHEAVRHYAQRGLTKGTDVLVVSIGVFTDDTFYDEICTVAATHNRRLLLASGALPAVDWMHGASLADVHSVTITQTKPVTSWINTPAAQITDLHALTAPTCFFTGSARDAARTFAKSSNITAMLALSTVGLDATQVRLVADPVATSMHTLVEFRGAAGEVRVEWRGVPSATNPSTSADVPLSVIKAIRNLTSPVCLGI
jgi:aspartate dehydrogenase